MIELEQVDEHTTVSEPGNCFDWACKTDDVGSDLCRTLSAKVRSTCQHFQVADPANLSMAEDDWAPEFDPVLMANLSGRFRDRYFDPTAQGRWYAVMYMVGAGGQGTGSIEVHFARLCADECWWGRPSASANYLEQVVFDQFTGDPCIALRNGGYSPDFAYGYGVFYVNKTGSHVHKKKGKASEGLKEFLAKQRAATKKGTKHGGSGSNL